MKVNPMREYIQSHTGKRTGSTIHRVDTYRRVRMPARKVCSLCKKPFVLRSRPIQKVYWSVQNDPEMWP